MTLNELIVSLCGLPTVSGSERRSTEALRGLIGAAFDEMRWAIICSSSGAADRTPPRS